MNKDNTNGINLDETGIHLITLAGPTASGKSSFAIALAKKIGGEIISADSAQVYRDLSIITARITPDEMEGIPHHLMGFLGLEEDFSLADFQKAAYGVIKEIAERGNIPIMAGGTGLYIKAVLEDYQFSDSAPNPEFRREMLEKAEKLGKEALYLDLERIDPDAASRIHPQNLQRVIRALEVIKHTGKPFSLFYRKGKKHPLNIQPYPVCLNFSREELYERINLRVDKMIAQGAIEEIRNLMDSGWKSRLEELRILGCRELMWILEGLCSPQEGIELLKRNTRRYAKRQLTWFRAQRDFRGINMHGREESEEIDIICRWVKENLQKPVNERKK